MKKLLWLALGLVSLSAFSMDDPLTFIDNLTVVKLSDITQNELNIATAWPGKNSGNCKLIIRARHSLDLTKLIDRLDFRTLSSGSSNAISAIPGAIIFKLNAGSEFDGVNISTKDGNSIAENVLSALGPFDDAGAMVGICSKLPPV